MWRTEFAPAIARISLRSTALAKPPLTLRAAGLVRGRSIGAGINSLDFSDDAHAGFSYAW
jgi:hypothetical protein